MLEWPWIDFLHVNCSSDAGGFEAFLLKAAALTLQVCKLTAKHDITCST